MEREVRKGEGNVETTGQRALTRATIALLGISERKPNRTNVVPEREAINPHRDMANRATFISDM